MTTITAKWFECSVRYDKTDENGTTKKQTEQYVVNALSFTEAEAAILKEMQPFATGIIEVVGMKPATYSEIAFLDDFDDTHFYKMKLAFITLDEKSGKEKRTNNTILVEGRSLHDALDGIDTIMQGSMLQYVSLNATTTKFLEVFRGTSEQK